MYVASLMLIISERRISVSRGTSRNIGTKYFILAYLYFYAKMLSHELKFFGFPPFIKN